MVKHVFFYMNLEKLVNMRSKKNIKNEKIKWNTFEPNYTFADSVQVTNGGIQMVRTGVSGGLWGYLT